MKVSLRTANKTDIGKVNEQYKGIGFKDSVYEDEIIVIAEIENHLVGLGRLQNIDGMSAELGGIYVRPEYRKHGLARKIVNHLLHLSKDYKTVYCIPFAHLENFYKSFGFDNVIDTSNVPERVLEKLDWCNSQYESDTILLKIENR